jgi:predicted RNA-binding protein with PUA-like domain
VRNFEARNNLRAMARGDRVLFYHSVNEKRVVGLAEVVGEAHPDSTAPSADWSAVDLAPLRPLAVPVTLEAIKADEALGEIALVKRSRLSVMPLTASQYRRILTLAKTKP